MYHYLTSRCFEQWSGTPAHSIRLIPSTFGGSIGCLVGIFKCFYDWNSACGSGLFCIWITVGFWPWCSVAALVTTAYMAWVLVYFHNCSLRLILYHSLPDSDWGLWSYLLPSSILQADLHNSGEILHLLILNAKRGLLVCFSLCCQLISSHPWHSECRHKTEPFGVLCAQCPLSYVGFQVCLRYHLLLLSYMQSQPYFGPQHCKWYQKHRARNTPWKQSDVALGGYTTFKSQHNCWLWPSMCF